MRGMVDVEREASNQRRSAHNFGSAREPLRAYAPTRCMSADAWKTGPLWSAVTSSRILLKFPTGDMVVELHRQRRGDAKGEKHIVRRYREDDTVHVAQDRAMSISTNTASQGQASVFQRP